MTDLAKRSSLLQSIPSFAAFGISSLDSLPVDAPAIVTAAAPSALSWTLTCSPDMLVKRIFSPAASGMRLVSVEMLSSVSCVPFFR